ncbi:MAG TPA: hypothetical protein DCQ26_03550 [Marinilabiliales bacterium]|jgi:tetratricopeptide (TPR) repeat protein|nr:hypothetical protein [Marinilabiliales bacterium]HAZ00724.1 hypothetical protein [Marinilabiliales bacterium]HBO76063.1 hypothetical protein [Marinilabiliales bacterium]HBX86260.1 hypothetical protein [Marinilabiliales bacterium]HBY53135.1 hypothetical protein [Marinilabiliales bacterium]
MATLRIIFFIAFVGILNSAHALGMQALLDSASTYYSTNQFEKAIASYEQVIASGYEASELYYNLGNAYFKSNKIALAIVNYERAKKLAPNDEDIDFNLNMANTFIVDKIEVIPEFFLNSWRSNFGKTLSTNQWSLLSISLFVSALVLLLVYFLSGKAVLRKISFWMGILFLIISLVSFTNARKQKWLITHEPEAIIITPSVVVKSAPSETGTELFLIHEGLKVKTTEKSGDWHQIRLSNGNKGWIKKTDFVII